MTLTELSYYSRRFLPIAAIGFFALIFFFLVIRLLLMAPKRSAQPTVYNTLFGKLPPLKPTHPFAYPNDISFTLDNIEGRPTTATNSAQIFFLPKKNTRFGYSQTISLMAKSFGFNTDEVKHTLKDSETAVFEDSEKKLTINIADFNFDFKLNYEAQPTLFDTASFPDESVIKDRAKEFLRLIDKYPEELSQGSQNLIYLHYNPTTQGFDVVDTSAQANVVEVDFFRPDIDSFPVVTPKYFTAQNFVVMVFKDDNYKVIKAQVKFFNKDTQTVGIYPVKTGDQAWQELLHKKGFIVSPGATSYPITIRKMFMGYYDPEIYQPYLQPVYVFLGDNNFAAYVPAISDEYSDAQSANP